MHFEHNNILCSSPRRKNGICCISRLQTSAVAKERTEDLLRLCHVKVGSKHTRVRKPADAKPSRDLTGKRVIQDTEVVGNHTVVDNLKVKIFFNEQRDAKPQHQEFFGRHLYILHSEMNSLPLTTSQRRSNFTK